MKSQLRFIAVAAISGALAAGAMQTLFSAYATQNELVPPTAGVFTGPQWSQKVGDAFRSLASGNKGPTAPANVGAAAVDGLPWIDDTTSIWRKKRYINGAWATEGAYDSVTSQFMNPLGGGITSIASSSGPVLDLGAVPQSNILITGTSPISGFGSSAPNGLSKIVRFDNALVLTNSANLKVPGGADLTTAADDRALLTHLGSGGWEITQYTRANGVPVDIAAVGKTDFTFSGAVPALHVRGDGSALARASYPAYLAKVTRAQNGTRVSANATITGIADTSGFGVGMPVEGTGVAAGCTIASVVANTSITLNSSACVTASGTSTVTVFLTGYGSGGGSTTVGVPNCGGAVLAGRETAASRLTSSFFGGNSTAMAAFSGNESVTMTMANLIQHNHGVFLKDPGHVHGGIPNPASTATTDVTGNQAVSGNKNSSSAVTGMTIGSVNGVANDNLTAMTGSASPTGMRTVQPTLIAECVVRVTP